MVWVPAVGCRRPCWGWVRDGVSPSRNVSPRENLLSKSFLLVPWTSFNTQTEWTDDGLPAGAQGFTAGAQAPAGPPWRRHWVYAQRNFDVWKLLRQIQRWKKLVHGQLCATKKIQKKFSSTPCAWAYFTNGPNAAASIASTLIRHWQ